MIDFLNKYTSKILCLAVFIGIINMIIPDGKQKQVIKFVSTLIITIVILEPFLGLINEDIDISSIFFKNKKNYETASLQKYYSNYYDEMLKESYSEKLDDDIISRLKNAGYKINNIESELDDETFEIKSLKVEIETDDGYVEPVRIEVFGQNDDVNFIDKYKIEKILVDNYGIDKDAIYIVSK